MFNQNGGYSLADIAAATGSNGNNGGGLWNDGGGWWIILLFLFAWGGNGWGWGGNGGGGAAYQGSTTREEIAYGFDINDLQNSARATHNGLCDGFYAMNTSLLNGFGDVNTAINVATTGITGAIQNSRMDSMQNTNAITAQLNNMAAANAACCCETQRLIEKDFADLNYNLASQECATRQAITDSTRDVIQNNNENTRAILDFLTQDKMAGLIAENQTLKFAASQANQNTYLIDQLRPSPTPAYIVANPYGCNCNSGVSLCGATF